MVHVTPSKTVASSP